MPDEDRQQVKAIFNAALEQNSTERERFIKEKCGDDETLQMEIKSLLSAFEKADGFLEGTAVEEVAEIIEQKNKFEKGKCFSHYEIIKKIGVGGMGEVYLARDKKLDRLVAVKILSEKFSKHEINRSRFIQEAKAASALNHPNILVIHEIGEEDDFHFIVSEYIEGQTLREVMAATPLNLSQVVDISIQIANALAAAHDRHLVHRDIKPENIMIRPDGVVKILDFGLAKLIEINHPVSGFNDVATKQNETAQGIIMGTVNYMSPEQAKGEKVDERTDLFSLGCVFYEMITGRTPFGTQSISETWTNLLQSEPEPLSSFATGVPAKVQEITSKMLSKDKNKRYATANSLLSDLKDLEIKNLDQNIRTTSIIESKIGSVWKSKLGLITGLSILLVLLSLGAWFYNSRKIAGEAGQLGSIAILPFQNPGGKNNDTEYLSDGITESLINSLTALNQLQVTARTTAFRYKDKEIDPLTVGRELNVRTVLTGRVRQIGDNLNIQVDLVDATTGVQLWGNEYDGKISDILSVKVAITREVTEKLKLTLTDTEQQQIAKRETTSSEAYKFYLMGRYFWNKRTPSDIKKAIEQFQHSVASDTNYALGYVGLADCYVLLQEYADIPGDEALFKARTAVEQALKINDSLAEAHASSAYIYLTEWHWKEAEKEFIRAIELNPNYPQTHHWFALFFMVRRQFDEALREIKRAQELDPVSPVIRGNVALVYLLKNEPGLAIEECQKIIDLDPNNIFLTREYLGLAYIKQKRFDKAIEEYEKAVLLSNRGARELSALGYLYGVMGKRAEALTIVKELEEKKATRRLFWVYAGLGNNDQVFTDLEKQFQQHSRGLRHITYNLFLEGMHSDPRYAEMVGRLGL